MGKELKSLADKVADREVCSTSRTDPRYKKCLQLIRQAEHGEAERLQEERATLTRFDTEFRELDVMIKTRSRRLLMRRSRSRS